MTTAPPRPHRSTVNAAAIPAALRTARRWLCWRYELRGDRWTKVPYVAGTNDHAKSTDAATWRDFDAAIADYDAHAYIDGVGFVLGDGWTGVDLDHCQNDAGVWAPFVQECIDLVDSYTELSPSGAGIHIIAYGTLPDGRRRTGQVEMYDSGRYFTVTGAAWPEAATEIHDRTAQLAALHARVFLPQPVDTRPQQVKPLASLDDQELLDKARNAKNGAQFTALYDRGDAGADHSAADLALCSRLAFWCGGDAAQIDRLFRASALMRDKWDRRARADGTTYGALTIEKAITGCRQFYDPTQPYTPEEPAAIEVLGERHAAGGLWRTLRKCVPPTVPEHTRTEREIWELLYRSIMDYATDPDADYILLLRSLPGTGKTRAAVKAMITLLNHGTRSIFCMPRHDMYSDLLWHFDAEAPDRAQELLQEWLPRTAADETRGFPETCRYAEAINTQWLNKGHEGFAFCEGVCGYDYINKGCPYHAQKRYDIISEYGLVPGTKRPPCLAAQHAHAVVGHPDLDHAGIVIIDENPVGAFLDHRRLHFSHLVPNTLPDDHDVKHLLHDVQRLAEESGEYLSGAELYTALGGAEYVLEKLGDFSTLAEKLIQLAIHSESEAQHHPHIFVGELAELMRRECKRVLSGMLVLPRVFVGKKHLRMLLRKPPNEKLPRHVVIMDGTADPRILEELFGRPVRVVDATLPLRATVTQIWNRANGIGSLFERGDDGEADTNKPTPELHQLQACLRALLKRDKPQRPALITFSKLETLLDLERDDILTLHYGAASGTNGLEDCDWLAVVGSYMPPPGIIAETAAMIWFHRDTPFNTAWTPGAQHSPPTVEVLTEDMLNGPYLRYPRYNPDGYGRAYPIGGYWSDIDLQAVMTQARAAELTQAVFRLRPTRGDSTRHIYLFFNQPLALVPPTLLVHSDDILGTRRVYTDKFLQFEELLREHSPISRPEFVLICDAHGISGATVKRYIGRLRKMTNSRLVERMGQSAGGKPPTVLSYE